MLSRSLRSLPAALSLSFTTAMAATTTATCQKAGVIFLHGLGDTPAGWSDIKHQMAQLNPKLASPEITWDFPAAPVIPISVNGGATMPGWFDLYDWPIDVTAPDDPAGTMRAVETIRGAIAKLEAAGVPTERIVVGGFSQGGAIALNTAYRHPAKLGGCVALSGWLNMKADFAEGKEFPTEASKATPCLWGHGAMDDKVLFPHQKIGVDLLTARGVTVDASNYPMGHSAHPEELAKLAAFLAGILFP